MDLIKCMDIAASGMSSQRTRLNVISMNLANANTTKTADGTPYKRKTAIFVAVFPVKTTSYNTAIFKDFLALFEKSCL